MDPDEKREILRDRRPVGGEHESGGETAYYALGSGSPMFAPIRLAFPRDMYNCNFDRSPRPHLAVATSTSSKNIGFCE